MSFIRPPSRGLPGAPPAVEKINSRPETIRELIRQGRHVAMIPQVGSWHPASMRGRRLRDAQEGQQEAVEEQVQVAPEEQPPPPHGRLARIPGDVLEHIQDASPMGHAIGDEATLETTRFGKHRVVAGEDGQRPLHPGLRGDTPPTSSRTKWRKNEDVAQAVEAIREQFGPQVVDQNGWPVQPPPEGYVPPGEDKPAGPSAARVVADAMDKIAEINRSDPAIVQAVLGLRRQEQGGDSAVE